MSHSSDPQDSRPWYSGITGYQWLVLVIASAGWVFDIYEGQIFNITRGDMLAEVLDLPSDSEEMNVAKKQYGDLFLAIFLMGGTVGGLLFGSLADRFGRRSIMVYTILMYSVFSGLTYFATAPRNLKTIFLKTQLESRGDTCKQTF